MREFVIYDLFVFKMHMLRYLCACVIDFRFGIFQMYKKVFLVYG